jgi:hypothetical protein
MAYSILIDMISMTMYPIAVNCRTSDTVDAFNRTCRRWCLDIGLLLVCQEPTPRKIGKLRIPVLNERPDRSAVNA